MKGTLYFSLFFLIGCADDARFFSKFLPTEEDSLLQEDDSNEEDESIQEKAQSESDELTFNYSKDSDKTIGKEPEDTPDNNPSKDKTKTTCKSCPETEHTCSQPKSRIAKLRICDKYSTCTASLPDIDLPYGLQMDVASEKMSGACNLSCKSFTPQSTAPFKKIGYLNPDEILLFPVEITPNGKCHITSVGHARILHRNYCEELWNVTTHLFRHDFYLVIYPD